MGAATFIDTAVGKDVQEAFDRLTEQARYEHGHGGYTGTIAEKHGYRTFTLPSVSGLAPSEIVEFCLNGIYDDEYASDAGVDQWTVTHRRSRLVEGKWVRDPSVTVPPIHRDALRRISGSVQDKWGDAGCVDITDTDEGRSELARWVERAKRTGAFKQVGNKHVRVGPEPSAKGQRVFLFFGWASS